MYDDSFDYYEPPRNMRFDKGHGPRGPPYGRGMRRRGGMDFRGPHGGDMGFDHCMGGPMMRPHFRGRGGPMGHHPFGPPPPNFNRNVPNAPAVDLSELWVETHTPEGKMYYYNAMTRETKWEKPETGKIINQAEIEAMAASSDPENGENQNSNSTDNGPNPFPFPMGPLPGMGMLPPPPFMGLPPPPFALAAAGAPGFPNFGLPPFALPIPNSSDEPSKTSTDVEMPATTTEGKESNSNEWQEYKSPDGRSYYHNKVSGESVWDKPPSTTSTSNDVESKSSEKKKMSSAAEPQPLEKKDDKGVTKIFENGTSTNNMPCNLPMFHDSRPDDNKSIDKSRPISSTPVFGTGWCIVYTGDGKVFFFNPSSMVSVWKIPDSLKGREDVEKMLSNPPASLVRKKPSDEPEGDSAPDPKKIKLEDQTENDGGKKEVNEPKVVNVNPKESAIEAELRAAKERDKISLEVRMAEFKQLLIDKKVSAFNTWEKELHKIVFDPRYLLITCKERKQVFDRYVKERAEEERNEKKKKSREKKEDFRKLLVEAQLATRSTFSDFAQRFAKDERFKMIEKMRERESLFNDFVQDLKRKEREEKSSQREKMKKDFVELLKEQKNLDRHSRWSEVKKGFSEDPRYKSVDSSSQREEWFKEYISKLSRDSDHDSNKDREKQERVEASLREREKEVQRTLSGHLRERDKERELHKHDEAIQHFKALLTDLVRTTEFPWHDVKKALRKDHRWGVAAALERDERERIFDEHINLLQRKKKEKFRELLDETQDITLSSTWKEVKKLIKEDPRCSKFSSSDRKCEKEFREYLKDKMVAAKADFRELLKETKLITYKSKKLIEETEHFHDIETILQNDKRYLVLQCIMDERKELLMSYIDTLERKGPPPPPTASEPSRRSAK